MFDKITTFLSGVLRSRLLPLALAGAALVLTLPSLRSGLVLDDYWHQAVLRRVPIFGQPVPSRLDLFRFFDGDPAHTRRLMDQGIFPWWTDPGIKGHFMRPVTALTHLFDHWLWPAAPALMHLQSVLWFALVVAAVALFYRRMMGASVAAGLAALLYAVDDAHGMPVGFLANRNAILATLAGVLAILAHVHQCCSANGGVLRFRWAWLLFIFSLLAGEAGIATTAYLFAFAVCLDPGGWRRGLRSLIPYAVIVVIWRMAWTAAGFGVDRIDFYVDPLTHPLDYLHALLTRTPLLIMGQFFLPSPEITLFLGPAAMRGLLLYAVVVGIILVILFYPMLRRDRVARFWAIGMLLSLPPICATLPADRLLWFTGIGGMGLLGQWLSGLWSVPRPQWVGANKAYRFFGRAAAVVFILLHLVAAPLLLPLRAEWAIGPPGGLRKIMLPALPEAALASKTVVFVNPPCAMIMGFSAMIRAVEGEPAPARIRVLAPGITPVEVERRDDRTLAVRPDSGFLAWGGERLVRTPQHPMRAGECVALSGMEARVTQLTSDGCPGEAVIRFDRPLEDPSYLWLAWRDGAWRAYTPPVAGRKERLSLVSESSEKAGKYQVFLKLLTR